MRLFTAIDIPQDVKAALAVILDKLRPLAKLKWIPLEKLHITTKFIGEWPDEPETRLDELKQALGSITGKGSIEIVIRGLGWCTLDLAGVDRGASCPDLSGHVD